MTFTTSTEKDLYNNLVAGNPEQVTSFIPEKYFGGELDDILFLWSQHRNDPVMFMSKMNNKIASLICEAANNIEELAEQQSEEDRRREMLDWHQECKADRIRQEGI